MKRTRTDADLEARDRRALEAWWDGVRNLGKEAYAAGKVLDLSAPADLHAVRGPDNGIRRLLVRKDFDALYLSIIRGRFGPWLFHLNGNSGIGKSAFLWYFIIRYGIDYRNIGLPFVLLYQSADFIWRFDSKGAVDLVRKSELPWTSFLTANWHLVNQKVLPSDALGRKVLVAASPDPDNIKNALPDRKLARVYLHPWERDEFDALTKLWEEEASQLEEEASQMEDFDTSDLEIQVRRCSVEKEYVQEIPDEGELRDTKLRARKLRKTSAYIRARVGAAGSYYAWFGGVPRRLWQLEPRGLSDAEMEKMVDTALLKTDLAKVYRAISVGAQAEDISWMLLHLKRPHTVDSDYLIDFASTKIKYKFTSSIAASKREDLKVLLNSSDPQLGALRGFIFEQEVVCKVLRSEIRAVLMVDNKHCSGCISRTDGGQGPVNWISCDVCKKWYHYLCVRGTAPVPCKWQCKGCDGEPADEVIRKRLLRLRYYRGDLKETLLKAGPDAMNYVWRPLKKNNGGFDFVILPATLGQATAAQHHPIPFEAIKDGVAALEAWNKEHNKDVHPRKFLLSFFLSQYNYPGFGYQSYRNKQGRVSNDGVRGIMQAKVLIQTFDDGGQPQLEQCADIPQPPNTVEQLDELGFQDFQSMTMDQLKNIARQRDLSGYSSLRKAQLIQKLLDSEVFDDVDVVDLEFEKSYYLQHGALVDE